MSDVQRIIKYCAIGFGIFIIFSIVSGIIGVFYSFGNIFDNNDSNLRKEFEKLNITSNSSILDIDAKSVNIIIKKGNLLYAETNNKYVNVKQDNNKIHITERKQNWYKNDNRGDLIIYIPSNMNFDAVMLNTGAGKIDIEELSTNKLYFELGAGKVNINKLNVYNEAEIEGGAGQIIINNGYINNLDAEIGVGKLDLNALLIGNNKIDSGVGTVILNLIGNSSDYKLNVDKGIGSIKVEGNELDDESVYGIGNNYVEIEGGIGSVVVDFVKEK